MNIVFAGTPEFAAVALADLIAAGHSISLVLTQPDRPAGRGMKLQASSVKQLALQHNLPVAQPAKMRELSEADAATIQAADVMIVAAYGLILPQSVLDMPRLGCLNIHASILPRWRGAAPIHRAIEAGDLATGVTIMQMDAGLDTGAMLLMESTPIAASDTTASLHDKLAALGGRLCVQALAQLERGELHATAQPEEGVCYAHKIAKPEAAIDWTQNAHSIERKVRAFNPFPICQTQFAGQMLKIWSAQAVEKSHNAPIGTALTGTVLAADENGIVVACGEHTQLKITELQRAGAKRMAVKDFLLGMSIPVGAQFVL